jgi:hypothetical protein
MTGGDRAICRNNRRQRIAYVRPMIEYEDTAARPPRNVMRAMLRGFAQRCPACGAGRLFHSYLKVRDGCPSCGEALFRPTSRS